MPSRPIRRASSLNNGLQVLVVEDNEINQKVAVMLLEKLGIQADVASNGRGGVMKFRSPPYDAVFMDWQMPEMNGCEATVHIRLEPGPIQRVPIIAMTAQAIEGPRGRCLEHGMDDFVSNPIKLDDIIRILDTWLPQSPHERLMPAVIEV